MFLCFCNLFEENRFDRLVYAPYIFVFVQTKRTTALGLYLYVLKLKPCIWRNLFINQKEIRDNIITGIFYPSVGWYVYYGINKYKM